MKKILILTGCFIVLTGSLQAQIFKKKNKDIEEDTLTSIWLDTVNVYARNMKTYNYNRYQKIVNKMYPYADTAVQLLLQVEEMENSTDKRKDEKKYKKELEKELKDKFEDRLKKLSRTEGYVMIEIIERNTGRSMYDILREVKNGSTAFWWQSFGRIYGYDLKESYSKENNPMLETLIQEYEIKHQKVKALN